MLGLHGRPALRLAAPRPRAVGRKIWGQRALRIRRWLLLLLFLLQFMKLLLDVPRQWRALTGMLVGSIILQFGLSFAIRHACWPHARTLNQKTPGKKEGKMDMAVGAIQLQPGTCSQATTCVPSVPGGGGLSVLPAPFLLPGWPSLPVTDVCAIITFVSEQHPTQGAFTLRWVW